MYKLESVVYYKDFLKMHKYFRYKQTFLSFSTRLKSHYVDLTSTEPKRMAQKTEGEDAKLRHRSLYVFNGEVSDLKHKI